MIGERAKSGGGSIRVLNNRRVEAGCEKLVQEVSFGLLGDGSSRTRIEQRGNQSFLT